MSWSPVQGVLPTVLDLVTEVKRKFHGGIQGLNWAAEPKEKNVSENLLSTVHLRGTCLAVRLVLRSERDQLVQPKPSSCFTLRPQFSYSAFNKVSQMSNTAMSTGSFVIHLSFSPRVCLVGRPPAVSAHPIYSLIWLNVCLFFHFSKLHEFVSYWMKMNSDDINASKNNFLSNNIWKLRLSRQTAWAVFGDNHNSGGSVPAQASSSSSSLREVVHTRAPTQVYGKQQRRYSMLRTAALLLGKSSMVTKTINEFKWRSERQK
jgi:hypothetical protein